MSNELTVGILFGIIFISMSGLVFAQNPEIIFTDGRIVNDFSQSVTNTETNIRIVIQAEITNGKSITQSYVYIITIKDQNGNIIWDSQTNSGVHSGKTKLLEAGWVPEIPGMFDITLEVFDSLESGKSLANPLFLTLEVTGEPVVDPILVLQEENQLLKERITELEKQIDNLNQLVMEQLNVIYTWILGQ